MPILEVVRPKPRLMRHTKRCKVRMTPVLDYVCHHLFRALVRIRNGVCIHLVTQQLLVIFHIPFIGFRGHFTVQNTVFIQQCARLASGLGRQRKIPNCNAYGNFFYFAVQHQVKTTAVRTSRRVRRCDKVNGKPLVAIRFNGIFPCGFVQVHGHDGVRIPTNGIFFQLVPHRLFLYFDIFLRIDIDIFRQEDVTVFIDKIVCNQLKRRNILAACRNKQLRRLQLVFRHFRRNLRCLHVIIAIHCGILHDLHRVISTPHGERLRFFLTRTVA